MRVRGKDEAITIYEPLGLAAEVGEEALGELERGIAPCVPTANSGGMRPRSHLAELVRMNPTCGLYRAYLPAWPRSAAARLRRAGTACRRSTRNSKPMRLRVLGCSGGIGGRHLRTTSFLVDADILIDAGTGVGDLTLAELSQIDHIFVTHSHLDHVASIPFLVDTIGGMRAKPIDVYAQARHHRDPEEPSVQLGDLARLHRDPDAEAPFLRYQEIEVGAPVDARRPRRHARFRRAIPCRRSAITSTAARRASSSPATPRRTTRSGAW